MAVIDAQAVSKKFLLRHNASAELKVRFLGLLHRRHRQSVEEFWALRDVSLQVGHGEGVGLVGRNGSGKSTLLKLIAAIHRPTSGRVLVARHARICSMIELGVGFHPELTGRENVFLNAAIQGLTSDETEAIYDGIVSYSGLEHFIDVPIKNYSSGMYMRLGFAIAANLDPDILLLDEIFAVGDADFQQRCVDTLRKFMERGKTILFVSHSADAVRTICRRTCVLDQGKLAFDGDVDSGLAFYGRLLAHPSESDVSLAAAQRCTDASEPASPVELEIDDGPNWMLGFLRQAGMRAGHRVLHVTGGGVYGARAWRSFLGDHNYVRLASTVALFELDAEAGSFDFIVVEHVFGAHSFNIVARCIASCLKRLQPSGRFLATWYENPDPANFEPITQLNGVTTYPDREPYHYPLALMANVCDSVGATLDRVGGPGHFETVLVISHRHAASA